MPPLCVQSQCSSEGEGRDGGRRADADAVGPSAERKKRATNSGVVSAATDLDKEGDDALRNGRKMRLSLPSSSELGRCSSALCCASLRTPSRSFVQLPLVGFYPPADVRVAKTKLSLPQNSPGDRETEGGSGGTGPRSQPASWKEASLVARSLVRSRDCNFRSFLSVRPRPSLPLFSSVGRRGSLGGQAHFLMFSSASLPKLLRIPSLSPRKHAAAPRKSPIAVALTSRESCAGGSTHLAIGEFIRHRRRPFVRFLILIPHHKSLGGRGGGGGRCQSGSLCSAAVRQEGERGRGERGGSERHL